MDNDAEVSAVGRRIVTEDGFFGTVLYDGPVKNDGRYFGIEWDDASRGKHSGTFQGTTYFTTTTPDSGSFLSADSKKLAPQTCFLAALEDKYQLDQPDDGLVLLGANQKVQVKTVGWEKIRQKQSNLSRLEIVGLANCRIGPLQRDAYIPESIASTCPFIQDLDLSKNLLGSWSDVAGIAKELKQLKSLRLAQCRFDPVVNGVDLEGAFEQVRALTLNATLMSWASLEQVIKYMPQLKELHFGWNELSEFGGNGEDLQSKIYVCAVFTAQSHLNFTW